MATGSNVSVINQLRHDIGTDYETDGYAIYSLHIDARWKEESGDVMPSGETNHQEAYYLYFVAALGIILNCTIVVFVIIRKPLRKMTSAFLIHACFLDFLKAAYCIPIGSNLITQQKPSDCDFFGATFVIIITISAFNMVAMVCSEAYTFGEINIGGNSRGTLGCVLFGISLVYVGSTILHLGPTLIGGYFEFNPDIGSCSFVLGKQTGYVANIMWIAIITIALAATMNFIRKLYQEIQINQPNRVSMLVRSSITVMDNSQQSACNLRVLIKETSHRARIFVLNTITFAICWYPLFLLMVIDVHFNVSAKVYQAFSFIAWSQGTIQPVLYICFDRNLDILAKYVYCDKYRYDLEAIAQLMSRHHHNTDQAGQRYSSSTDNDGQGQNQGRLVTLATPCQLVHDSEIREHSIQRKVSYREPSPASTQYSEQSAGQSSMLSTGQQSELSTRSTRSVDHSSTRSIGQTSIILDQSEEGEETLPEEQL